MPNVAVSLSQGYRTTARARTHVIHSDEPVEHGGDDSAQTPNELLLSAIGSCMAITMKLYATRKKWPLERVGVDLESRLVKAAECPEYVNPDGREQVTVITARIRLDGPLTLDQKTRIAEIGGRCPVHRTVAAGAHFIDELAVD
jgi:putative redox protein